MSRKELLGLVCCEKISSGDDEVFVDYLLC